MKNSIFVIHRIHRMPYHMSSLFEVEKPQNQEAIK